MEGHHSQFSRLHVVDLNLIHVSPLSSFYNSEAFIGISKVTQKRKEKKKFAIYEDRHSSSCHEVF